MYSLTHVQLSADILNNWDWWISRGQRLNTRNKKTQHIPFWDMFQMLSNHIKDPIDLQQEYSIWFQN